MAKEQLHLFGTTIELEPGKLHIVGGFQNTLKADLSPDATLLDVDFQGALPFGSTSFSGSLPCRIENGTVRLLQTVLPCTSLSLDLPLGVGNWQVDAPRLYCGPQLSDELGIGFMFDDPQHILGQRLRHRIPDSIGFPGTLSWGRPDGWTTHYLLEFDFAKTDSPPLPDPHVTIRPGGANNTVFAVVDSFLDLDTFEGPERKQLLALRHVRASVNRIQVSSTPHDPALYVHPDLLSTHDALADLNDILYQYALVNGVLEIDAQKTNGVIKRTFSWRKVEGSDRKAGMLVFRLTDEHGHPLLLERTSFPLSDRKGVLEPPVQTDPDNEQGHWEQTIRGLICFDPATRLLEDVHVRSIDPASVDLEDDEYEWRWFDAEGRITPGPAPTEVHGFSKGIFFERVSRAGDAHEKGLHCALNIEEVTDPTLGRLYTQTNLKLNARDWQLRAQLEEREVYHGVCDQPRSPEIQMRKALPKSTADDSFFQLPLIDTSYALANLADPGGRVTSGTLMAKTHAWLRVLDAQFAGESPQVFAPPDIDDRLTHLAGFQVIPAGRGHHPFASVIDLPPGSTLLRTGQKAAHDLGRTAGQGARMLPGITSYLHGGERTSEMESALRNRMLQPDAKEFRKGIHAFMAFWNTGGLTATQRAAHRALRDHLALRYSSTQLAKEASLFVDALRTARAVADRTLDVDGFNAEILTQVETLVTHIPETETLKQYWDATLQGGPLDLPAGVEAKVARALMDFLWSPPTLSLYRLALKALYVEQSFDAAVSVELQKWIKAPAEQAGTYLKETLSGFLSTTIPDVDQVYQNLVALWNTNPGGVLDTLRRRYGSSFSQDVYERLLQNADDVKTLLERYRAVYEDHPIHDLAKVAATPPDYLFFTSSFPLEGIAPSTLTTAENDKIPDFFRLWNHQFDLCQVGPNVLWRFFLDSDSSVIVKLAGSAEGPTLRSILTEVHRSYATVARPNPLNVPIVEPHQTVEDDEDRFETSLNRFIDSLHPDLQGPHWRGILIINPTADIGSDDTLRDLAGFQHIRASYVALGGRRPEASKPEAPRPALDTYARIYQEAVPMKDAGTTKSDLTLTLVKFDVSIKHTRLESGEIVFRLDPKDMWGKTDDFGPIFLSGTLPPEGTASAARNFEFAARLSEPHDIPIDLAFLKSFTFRSLRVARHRGQASIEIDGKLNLQRWEPPVLDIPFDGIDGIDLQNFRILLPNQEASARMGTPRALNFEFPALTLKLNKPRSFSVFGGIELKPFGLGYVRDNADAINRLRGRYQWLGGHNIPDTGTFPFIECEIDFGKLPRLGDTNLSGLRIQTIVGITLPEKRVFIGLSGLDAKDITIDFFRLLCLELETISLKKYRTTLNHQNAVALFVENPRLTLLDWSPLPPGKMKLLLAHSTSDGAPAAPDRPPRRAALGWYAPTADDAGDDAFFRLHWVLLAHNLKVEDKIMHHLLGSTAASDPATLLDGLVVDKPLPQASEIRGEILDDDTWLFGTSFRLGDILDRCTLLLHDQHYYGISLSADWLKGAIGQDRIELAYLPGATRDQDRFRTNFRLPALDLLGPMRSGELAIEWGVNWDFLLDFGFPWRVGNQSLWERAFSMPMGTYEAQFGWYLEKRTQLAPTGQKQLVLSAGVGFAVGYRWGVGTPGRFVWAEVGIGVFATLEGSIYFDPARGGLLNPFKATISRIVVRGVFGIYAYGRGGIEIWVISARFAVDVQAAIQGELDYRPNGRTALTYAATLSARYAASVRVGSGWFSFTFRVSGSVDINVTGRLLLS